MRKSLISDIVVSIIMFGIGLFLLMYGQATLDTIVVVLGVSLILYGVFNIGTYFRYRLANNPITNLVYGVISTIFGIVLVIDPGVISRIIAFIVGAIILFISIPSLIDGIKNKDKVNTISIGLSIAGIVIGVLCLIGKLLPTEILCKFLGLMLIIYSIVNFINTVLLNQGLKKDIKIINAKNDIIKK